MGEGPNAQGTGGGGGRTASREVDYEPVRTALAKFVSDLDNIASVYKDAETRVSQLKTAVKDFQDIVGACQGSMSKIAV